MLNNLAYKATWPAAIQPGLKSLQKNCLQVQPMAYAISKQEATAGTKRPTINRLVPKLLKSMANSKNV